MWFFNYLRRTMYFIVVFGLTMFVRSNSFHKCFFFWAIKINLTQCFIFVAVVRTASDVKLSVDCTFFATRTKHLDVWRNPHLLRNFQWSNVPLGFYKFIFTKFVACSKPLDKNNHCKAPYPIVIATTFYSPSSLCQKTAKWHFGLRVQLTPAHLFTTHGGGFTLSSLVLIVQQESCKKYQFYNH